MSRIPPSRTVPRRIASVGLASLLLLGGAPAISAAAATEASALDARTVATTADAPALEAGDPSAPSAHTLRSSGLDAGTLLGFWVGGGALALATAGVLVSVTKRRVRRETDPSD